MATKITRDWRDLFDIALFEPNRAKLRTCIEHAKRAIRNRLDALMLDSAKPKAKTEASRRNALHSATH